MSDAEHRVGDGASKERPHRGAAAAGSRREIDALAGHAARARGGSDAAVRDLVTAAAGIVRRWALVHTGAAAEADDVAQEVLMRMVGDPRRLPAGRRFGPWLYAVTRNAAIDRLRQQARRPETGGCDDLLDATPAVDADPAAVVSREEIGSLLGTFFDELPRRQREVFDLVELRGMPAAEVARLLRIRPASVRASMFKARRTLRRRVLETWPDIGEGLR